MTRGNISKATRVLHLTEDVFCGCNHTLRGARIRYKEYISCGKGRDMGFDSINGFNFKVGLVLSCAVDITGLWGVERRHLQGNVRSSSCTWTRLGEAVQMVSHLPSSPLIYLAPSQIAGGGGEWAMSRESYRLGTRFDFFRMMAYYHAGVGFYINSWFTFLAVYLNVYALLLFAWAQATEIQAGGIQRVYNVQQVLQLGTLALIPYAGQLMLENGVVSTCLTLFQQIATGGEETNG
jgi:1,3-beta-glucan synthase